MTLIGSGWTWINAIPGFNAADAEIAHQFGNTLIEGNAVHSIVHLALSLVSVAVIVAFTMITRGAWAKSSNAAIPAEGFSIRNFMEMILDTCLTLGEQVLGSRKQAERFLPLIGALAIYIFFHNVFALIPGFAPATDNLNVTVGPAIVVFFATHLFGLKDNGLHYLEHFLGPKIGGFPLLAPIMLPIELISHAARPLSLSLRLFGNMFGDHAVLAIFLGLVAIPIVYPVPIMLLGTVVVIVQTLVFCLLTLVYIALAIEHSEEAH
ncbi:MAG: F-type H+-transporting ATPase subunit a [Bradymonadia bacterium]|jgi:F-type H+-transporting ATPase subunit a